MDIILYCMMIYRLRYTNKAYLSLLFGYLGILMIVFLLPVFSMLLGFTGIYYGKKYKKNVMKSMNFHEEKNIDISRMLPFELKFVNAGILLGETSVLASLLYMGYISFITIRLFS